MWRSNRLPTVGMMILGLVILVALGSPQSAFALHRAHFGISLGVQINASDYDYLSDYGEWVDMPNFGTVWHPFVVAGWEPFFNGHWTWTTDGWAWVSYEPFGWLVYHYGYWYYDDSVGWFWVPGRVWSPARVEWYTYGDYCGWAPLPPPGFFWPDPWVHRGFDIWCFVNIDHFTDENIGHHRIGEFPRDLERREIWRRRGPDLRHLENVTHRQISPMRIPRERITTHPETGKYPPAYYRSRGIQPQRMVLPDQERSRVNQYAPQVQRDVLVPKDKAPRIQQQRPPESRPESRPEGRPQTRERGSVRRR